MMGAAPALVVATAGHVDHGKSTLVQALTGTDPDRFAEEHRRGMSLDLGFAFTELSDGRTLALVDVPGHHRFVRTMAGGAASVDAALLVVDAGEGWRQQSEEHHAILELLGVESVVVALTKVGSTDPATLEHSVAQVRERLAISPWPTAPLVRTDSLEGIGLDELRDALLRLPAGRNSLDAARPRLWIDRAFTVAGAGTVVTGTLTGGALSVGEHLDVLPAGHSARVRSLQTAGEALESARPGTRVAVNLVGVEARYLRRGDVLVRASQWHPSTVLDVELQVLAGPDKPLGRRGAHLMSIGSADHEVRISVLCGESIAPGASGLARVHLPTPLPLVPGDRFVLRDTGRDTTIGGGEVLEVDPLLPAVRAQPDRRLERIIAERGWVDVDELERRTGARALPTVGRWVVDPLVLHEATDTLRDRVGCGGPTGIALATLDERDQVLVATIDDLSVRGTRVVRGHHDPLEREPWLHALRAHLFDPPPKGDVDARIVRDLVAAGLVVPLPRGPHVAREAVAAAEQIVRGLCTARPEGCTVGEVRQALGSSRRVTVPLLEHLASTGATERNGDLHRPRIDRP